MPELQQVRDLVGLPSAQAEVLDRDPDQCSLVMLSVFSKVAMVSSPDSLPMALKLFTRT